jgi:hypothetical protein
VERSCGQQGSRPALSASTAVHLEALFKDAETRLLSCASEEVTAFLRATDLSCPVPKSSAKRNVGLGLAGPGVGRHTLGLGLPRRPREGKGLAQAGTSAERTAGQNQAWQTGTGWGHRWEVLQGRLWS